MKGNAKCRKWGVLGTYGSQKVTGKDTIQHSAQEVLLAFHSNCSWTVSSELLGFLFYFSLFFRFWAVH